MKTNITPQQEQEINNVVDKIISSMNEDEIMTSMMCHILALIKKKQIKNNAIK